MHSVAADREGMTHGDRIRASQEARLTPIALWIRAHQETGELAELPAPMIESLVMGPVSGRRAPLAHPGRHRPGGGRPRPAGTHLALRQPELGCGPARSVPPTRDQAACPALRGAVPVEEAEQHRRLPVPCRAAAAARRRRARSGSRGAGRGRRRRRRRRRDDHLSWALPPVRSTPESGADSAGLGPGGHRAGGVLAPLGPGARVEGRRDPRDLQGQHLVGARDPGPAVDADRGASSAPSSLKRRTSASRARKRPSGPTFRVVGATPPRDVPGHRVDGLDLAPVPLLRPRVQQQSDLATSAAPTASSSGSARSRPEVARHGLRDVRRQRAAPRRQAAVQDADVPVAGPAQQPPGPRRGPALPAVGSRPPASVRRDPGRAHRRTEGLRVRQRMAAAGVPAGRPGPRRGPRARHPEGAPPRTRGVRAGRPARSGRPRTGGLAAVRRVRPPGPPARTRVRAACGGVRVGVHAAILAQSPGASGPRGKDGPREFGILLPDRANPRRDRGAPCDAAVRASDGAWNGRHHGVGPPYGHDDGPRRV